MTGAFIADTETIIECLFPSKYDRHVLDWRRERWLKQQSAWNDEALARVNDVAALIILRAQERRVSHGQA